MAKQVSKTVIGGFVISAIALLVAGVLIFGGGKFFKKTQKFVLFFEGSVKGLKAGAPVAFRGVEMGSVESVMIYADHETRKTRIPVFVELEPDRVKLTEGVPDPQQNIKRLIESGLRAQLTLESLVTGQLMVELDFHPDTPVRLVGADFKCPGVTCPELPTIPSTFEQIAKTVQKLPIEEIFEKLLAAVDGIEKVLNSPDLKDTIASLKVTVQDADKLMNDTNKFVNNLDRQIEPLAESIRTAATDASKLVKGVDRDVEPLASDIRSAADGATAALEQAGETLRAIEGVAGEDSMLAYELTNALKELSSAARSIRILADYLEQNPDALIRGKGSPGGQ